MNASCSLAALLQLEPVAGNYDDGPFRLNVRFQKATATRSSQFNRMGFDVLEQMGHNVYAVEAKSLPPQSKVVFSSMDGGVVVAVIPYCQGFPSQYDNAQTPVAISVDRCGSRGPQRVVFFFPLDLKCLIVPLCVCCCSFV
jgi:hypothetical protein